VPGSELWRGVPETKRSFPSTRRCNASDAEIIVARTRRFQTRAYVYPASAFASKTVIKIYPNPHKAAPYINTSESVEENSYAARAENR